MATKDKIVNLEDLKVSHDDLDGKVSDLKSALGNGYIFNDNYAGDLNDAPTGWARFLSTCTNAPGTLSGYVLTLFRKNTFKTQIAFVGIAESPIIFCRSFYNGSWSSWRGNVISVNSKTGVVSINKTDIGLGNVDNTSDADKPISDAQATVNGKKVNQPLDENEQPTYGTSGQVLRTEGNGETSWVDVGQPTDEQTASAISAWLTAHPEAVTTVDFTIVDKVFNTVSDMVDDTTLTTGCNVKTNGYHSINDGGGAFYKIGTTASRAGSVLLDNGLYAVLIGNKHNSRQIGLEAGDYGQDIINAYIADTSYNKLTIIDNIVLKKSATGTQTDTIELVKIRRDHFILSFEAGGKFTLETLNEDYYRMIAIREAEDITIINPVLVGDAETTSVLSGEYGHGLYIILSDNIRVYNGNISKCFGDGVVVTDGNSNVSFVGELLVYDCRRQGMTVGGCDGLFVDTIVGKNINGTAPGAVVNFESSIASEARKIKASISNIYSYDCNYAVLVADKSDKNIRIGNVFSYHTDGDYEADFQVYGCIDGTTTPSVNVYCDNLTVYNAYKTVMEYGRMNEKMSVAVNNVTVKGMNKARLNSTSEATIVFASDAWNIVVNSFNVYENVSGNANISIYASSGLVFENVKIKYYDDCVNQITSNMNRATVIDTLIEQELPNNTIYYLCSSNEVFRKTKSVDFNAQSNPDSFTVLDVVGDGFKLYKYSNDSYTIVDAQSIVTNYTGYWHINGGFAIVTMIFDHINKTITIKKI